ncbi:hypothetical protein GEMRC1_009508 [Eukaryota sp. GEM-RC1]
MVFSIRYVEDSVDEIMNNVDVALTARATAADVTITHRTLSTYLQYFSGFGDLFFLHKFKNLYFSGHRERLIRQIMEMDLTNAELSALSTGNTHLNEIKYLEQISLSLLTHVFSFPPELFPNISEFEYNIDSETIALERQLEFPTVSHWYTNSSHDSSLQSDDILTLSRHTICSPRWLSINSRYMSSMEGVPNMIVTSRTEEITQMVQTVRNFLNFNIILLVLSTAIFIFTLQFIIRKRINEPIIL